MTIKMSFSSHGKAKLNSYFRLLAAVVCSAALTGCGMKNDPTEDIKTELPAALPSVTQFTTSAETSSTTCSETENDPDSETVSSKEAASPNTETSVQLPETVSTTKAETVSETESITTTAPTAGTGPMSETAETTVPTSIETDISLNSDINTDFRLPETELPSPDETEPATELPAYEKEFFSNDLFIGDSISTGYSLYGFLNEKNVFAKIGLNPSSVLTKSVATCYGEIGIEAMLGYTNPKRVYIMLGSNGIQWLSASNMLNSTDTLVELISQACPQCEIVIVSVPPVTPKYDATVPDVDIMEKINIYNKGLSGYCSVNNMLFVDAASCLKNDEGYFNESYAESDGMHFKAAAYKTLLSKIQADVTEFEVLHPSEWVDPATTAIVTTETTSAETEPSESVASTEISAEETFITTSDYFSEGN